MTEKTKEYRQNLAEIFANILEEKALDWKKGWDDVADWQSPENATTGKRYRGINRFFLSLIRIQRKYQDPRWATFQQIKKQGWHLKEAKGQGVKVEYWYPYDPKEKKAISWETFRMEQEDPEKAYQLRVAYSTVFNGDLIEGIPELSKPEVEKRDIVEDEIIERLSKSMGVPIKNDGGNAAYYNLTEDQVHLPEKEYFHSDYVYNVTALHELAHATGNKSRLDRDMGHPFQSPEYAFEELVAEMSSCFMAAELQIPQTDFHIENHKAYVQSWIRAIRNKPDTLIRAISLAEKTTAYMEYHAGLVEQKEYEKTEAASMEIEETKIMEEKTVKEPDTEEMEVQALFEAPWDIEKQGTEYLLRFQGQEIQQGDRKEMEQIARRIAYGKKGHAAIGETLQILRSERGYTREQMADIALVSEGEYQAIEEGHIYPDKLTLQMICNACRVLEQELVHGQIAPKKSSEEIAAMLLEIRGRLDEIREDTQYFQEFIRQNKIPLQMTQPEHAHLERRERDQKPDSASNLIRKYEQSIGRNESMLKRQNTAEREAYAARCRKYLEFGEQVESCLKGELSQRTALQVGETPGILQKAGCKPLPMHITQRHLRDCLREKDDRHPEYHGLTIEQIKRLPETLEHPILIAESITREDSLVISLGYKDNVGNPIIVSMVPDGSAFYQLETVSSNFITSVYGRENYEGFVDRLIESKKLIYLDKEKSEELALLPVQFRQDHPAPAFNCIIQKMGAPVNPADKAESKIGHIQKEHSMRL